MANQNRIKMRIKILIYLFIYLFILSCEKNITYYHGYVYNKNEPIKNIKIIARDHPDTISVTNNKGYFKMTKRENWIEHFLYVYSNGVKVDSIQVIRTHPVPEYYFVEGRIDTLFLQIDK